MKKKPESKIIKPEELPSFLTQTSIKSFLVNKILPNVTNENIDVNYVLQCLSAEYPNNNFNFIVYSPNGKSKNPIVKRNIDFVLRQLADDDALTKKPKIEGAIHYKRATYSKNHEHALKITHDVMGQIVSSDDILSQARERNLDAIKLQIYNHLKNMHYLLFQDLCIKLLGHLGFGSQDPDWKMQAGKDGGKDGILLADVLGLQRIILQCKQQNKNVDVHEIREFKGILGDHSNIAGGVYITLSDYTDTAEAESKKGLRPLRLIKGKELVELILDKKLLIQEHNIKWISFFDNH